MKRYIREDQDGWIIHSFYDDIETVLEGDICIDTADCSLWGSNVPPLSLHDGRFKFKLINNAIVYQLKPFSTDQKMASIRIERDRRLQITDYIITRHVEQTRLVALGRMAETTITEAKYIYLLLYRQQLRDLPATIDPDNTVYPTQPVIGG